MGMDYAWIGRKGRGDSKVRVKCAGVGGGQGVGTKDKGRTQRMHRELVPDLPGRVSLREVTRREVYKGSSCGSRCAESFL